MTQENWPSIPPKKILLATDLSARGDRALDRATQLAATWDAELVIVHAVEGDELASPGRRTPSWRRPPDPLAVVERQIREDVRGDCPRLRVFVDEGPADQVILDVLERERCDLVVMGVGRHRPWGLPGVGRTVDELFRRSPVSTLVVKRRPRGPYAHVLVGTDFTDESRHGLEIAARLFGDATFAVMHAFEMPYRALLLESQLSQDFAQMEQETIRRFVAEAELPDDLRVRLISMIEHGPPEAMLAHYAAEQRADLVVIGAYERSKLFHVVIGGKGPRIVEAAPADVLVVRPQRPD